MYIFGDAFCVLKALLWLAARVSSNDKLMDEMSSYIAIIIPFSPPSPLEDVRGSTIIS
jgi:hypothetical protein